MKQNKKLACSELQWLS